MNIFKWLWEKAEKHGEQKVLAELYSLRSYHNLQAELAFYKEKYEPKKDDEFSMYWPKPLSPNEHGAVAGELGNFLSTYEQRDEVIQEQL